jgi:lipopolysaccharide heptosyltransferase II
VPPPDGPSGLTILQVLSWLNYGGVESYAIALSRALQQRGHRVIVASSGGQLVPELRSAGLEHFQVDFTGPRLLPGVIALRRLLEQEQVDLVNAHNWRAGLACYLACRRAGVPHVLTIHGTRRPLHRHGVFYWSKHVLAVSEASRQNLVRGFGLAPERVLLTRIAVDCERFRPSPPDAALEVELGLRPGAPRVVHVSRFSRSKARVASALIAAMRPLEANVPGVELVLVGQGPEESAIAAEAEDANRQFGRRAVFALGGRSDIARLLALADVVVATATAALEAMACGKPVLAGGKGGYFGLVTPENLADAENSCFGDHRDLEPLAPERLAADLRPLLCDPQQRARLGTASRAAVEACHSAPQVAAEVEDIYGRVLCDRGQVKKIVVFHLNQIGDLLFTLPALKALREAFPQAHITSVVRPHLAALLASGGLVDAIWSRRPGPLWLMLQWGAWLRRDLRPDLAITFSQSASMAFCAWRSGAPHRVGYLDSDLCRLLNHRVQVRGIPSPTKVLRLLRAMGLVPAKSDYVGLLGLTDGDRAMGNAVLERYGGQGDGPLVALAPGESSKRPYKAWTAERFRDLAEALVRARGVRLVVVGGERDRHLGDAVLSALPGSAGAGNLVGRTTPYELAAVLAQCDLLIGIDSGPMHLAAALGKPVVALFGPTDPALTGPQGEGHEVIFHRQPCWRPCIHPMIPKACDRRCLKAITVEEVLAAAHRALDRMAEDREPQADRAIEPAH